MIELAAASASSTASRSDFFARWADHDTWDEWSPDMDWVRLDSPATLGATGTLKPTGGPKVRFIISAFEPGREYSDMSTFPGARLVFQHLVEATPFGSDLTVRVTVDGPLARLWASILGKGFSQSAPEDLARLIALVEHAGD